MVSLILASGLFLGIHIFVSGTGLRGRAIAALGERAYQGLFSLASLGALVWMSYAYSQAPSEVLWQTGTGARHGAAGLMLAAMILVVFGLTTPNPTSAGQENVLRRGADAATGIIKITRHPFLWGVALWAVAHLLPLGDVAALVFFGSFLALALYGPFLIDAKCAKRDPDAWVAFTGATSWLPFQAVVQGRVKLTLKDLSWWRLGVAIVIHVIVSLFVHEWLFGVAPLAKP
jgi:uncharacterized membrane protein